MTCQACDGTGFFPFVLKDNPKPDAAIKAGDLCFAVCLCAMGRQMRTTENAGRRTGVALWEVWAAREQVSHDRIVRLEDVATANELAEWGLSRPDIAPSRDAALLAVGKGRRTKL